MVLERFVGTTNGALKKHLLKVLCDTFLGSLKNSLNKRFFKEPWFERFFEEPDMVLLWQGCPNFLQLGPIVIK